MYFLAMEITSRRFASTISFLARRACASPSEISRLMSLISWIVSVVNVWSFPSRLCERRISFLRRLKRDECLRLARMCFSIQVRSASLPWKLEMKSMRGM